VFERISNSWSLARSSWQVLRQDKKLVVFPILSGLACLVVVVSFVVPLTVLFDRLGIIDDKGNAHVPWWGYLIAFAFYFCNYFVVIFFNSALISCALMRFNGEEATLGDGLEAAGRRLPQILAWSLVSATVGVLLKAIENAHEKVGQFISAILGTAWSVMTYFVVPVLVVEKVGPFQAISRSLALLRKAWGEALLGNIGLGLFNFLLALPGILLLLGAGAAAGAGQPLPVVLILAGLGLLALLAAAVVGAALSTIYLGALYQFASADRVPLGFERDTLSAAFRRR
jgi:hypothetical protein